MMKDEESVMMSVKSMMKRSVKSVMRRWRGGSGGVGLPRDRILP